MNTKRHVLLICIFGPLLLLALCQAARAVEGEAAGRGRELQAGRHLGLSQEELAFLRANPVIRVGNEEGWAPFDFNEHGKPRGYAIDHLELLGQKLGISFEYINGYTWSELLELFKQGAIDLLPSLWISKSRKQFMLFTEPYIELPYVLVTKNDTDGIADFHDLQDKTVAVARGYKQEEVLNAHYPSIDQHMVEDALAGLKAVSYGKAEAYIGYRGTVDYLIATKFFTDLRIRGEVGVPELGPQGLYIAVQPKMRLLRSALQKAMDAVSQREKVRLARKWIAAGESLFPSLTQKERAFLHEHKVLRVDNLKSWPPFNFHENGEAKGFCIDYVDLLAEKLGIEVELVTGPSWKDFLGMVRSGDIDLLCDVVETKQRREFIDFTRPYFEIFSGIVTKKDRDKLSDLDALSGKKVAVPDNFYYEEILEKHYPSIVIVAEKNILECLKAVSSGKADAALAEKPVFDYLINKHFLIDLQSVPIMDNVHFENTPVSIGVGKGKKTLQGIIQKAMNAVTEEEVKALKRKWLDTEPAERNGVAARFTVEEREYLASKESLRMCVTPSRLPFEDIDEQGNHTGIIADILRLIAQRIGLRLEVVPASSRNQSAAYAASGTCDIVSGLSKRPTESKRFLFSKPYLESMDVIVTKDDAPYIPDLQSLAGKDVGVVAGDVVEGFLKDNYPAIRIRTMASEEAALRMVAKEKVDAAIAGLQTASYTIHELGLYSLKIAGQTPFKRYFRIGVSKADAPLRPILNKAVASLSSQKINRISQKWLSIKYEHGFNYQLFWQVLAVLAVVVGIFIYWNRKLSRLNQKLAEAHQQLAHKSEELEKISVTDGLTGLFNRLRLEEILHDESERSRRYMRPLSVIMMDIDRFKGINDTFGHRAGDGVLRDVSEAVSRDVRQADTVGRWGGEEFIILCPETDLRNAAALAEKLRKRIEGLQLQGVGSVTSSFGVAELQAGEEFEDMIHRADEAMYRAKQKGRNRVEPRH